MTLTRKTTLSLDASCFVAAAGSLSGGSALLLSVCAAGFLSGLTSRAVLLEAERTIASKLPTDAMQRYRLQLQAASPSLVPVPSASVVAAYEPVVYEDAHVVASAIAARAEYLITLDRRLIGRIETARYPLAALRPGEFIQTRLPTHVEYRSIR